MRVTGNHTKWTTSRTKHGVITACVPTVSLGYSFVGKTGEEQLKVLVVRDGESKAVFAHVVSRKGGGGGGVVRAVAEDLDLMGNKRVLLKGDQELAFKELRSKVKTAWNGEKSWATRPSAALKETGRMKGAIRSVEGQVRVLNDDVEWRTGCVLAASRRPCPGLRSTALSFRRGTSSATRTRQRTRDSMGSRSTGNSSHLVNVCASRWPSENWARVSATACGTECATTAERHMLGLGAVASLRGPYGGGSRRNAGTGSP